MTVPVGVPASVAVPLPLLVKVTPDGSVPVDVSAAMGNPVVMTVKLNDWPTAAFAVAALVNTGTWLAGFTVKLCWTCAAGLKVALPAWLASSVQVPAAKNDTTPEPSMLHAPSEEGSTVMTGVSPDVAAAVGA